MSFWRHRRTCDRFEGALTIALGLADKEALEFYNAVDLLFPYK